MVHRNRKILPSRGEVVRNLPSFFKESQFLTLEMARKSLPVFICFPPFALFSSQRRSYSPIQTLLRSSGSILKYSIINFTLIFDLGSQNRAKNLQNDFFRDWLFQEENGFIDQSECGWRVHFSLASGYRNFIHRTCCP